MNRQILKLEELVNKSVEAIIDKQGPKRLTINNIIQKDGSIDCKYLVYMDDSNTPIMGTVNIKDAITRYNAIKIEERETVGTLIDPDLSADKLTEKSSL